jgi:hypothetical protein
MRPDVRPPAFVYLAAGLFICGSLWAEAPLPATKSPPPSASEIEANGIRTLTSKYLILCTDVPSNFEIDQLPGLFDKAVPQWAEYFGVDVEKASQWQARAYLIGDRRRFEALHLLPPGREDFVNGISMGAELWLHDQPTPYYRRHLLLHEGTHVFMESFLGGCGPGWYMEGTAELFGTHRLDDKTNELTMRIMPKDRTEVPMLGRIKLIRDSVAQRHILSLSEVMRLDNRVQMNNESYAWCWAAAKFLDSHPRYRGRFRALSKYVEESRFNDKMRRDFYADWNDLQAEWQAFVVTLDHGFDFERIAIDFQKGQPLVGPSHPIDISAERGWQSSGVWLEANQTYKVTASGRYQIATEDVDGKTQAWPCEPGGVSIVYNDGHPLGILLGAIHTGAESPSNGRMSFAEPIPIGLQAIIKPMKSGTLYLRVNDSAAKLDDNRGSLTATVERVTDADRK